MRPENVLLLQPWSTAMIQTKNNRIALAAIILLHMGRRPPIWSAKLSAWILQQDELVRRDTDHGQLIFQRSSPDRSGPASFGWVAAHRLISAALKHRQPRILGKFRIGSRKPALIKNRSAIGLDSSHKLTVGAKADTLLKSFSCLRAHQNQNNAPDRCTNSRTMEGPTSQFLSLFVKIDKGTMKVR